MIKVTILALATLGVAAPAHGAIAARAHHQTARKVEVPTYRLTYSQPLHSPILKAQRAILGGPLRCGPEGAIAFPAYRQPNPKDRNVAFSLYTIKIEGDSLNAVRYAPGLATNLRNIIPAGLSLAISQSRVVFVVYAVTNEEYLTNPKTKRHPFLLIYNRTGDLIRAAPLNVGFPIGGIGLYHSGDILVVGSTVTDPHQHWVVVNDDGVVQQDLTPARPNALHGPLNGTVLSRGLAGLKGFPQIIPWHGNLIAAEMNTTNPIVEINEGGVVRSVKLKISARNAGETINKIIPSNGDTWDVVLGHTVTSQAPNGRTGYEYDPDKIGEFSSQSGKLLDWVNPGKKISPASIACRHGDSYTALSFNYKTGMLLMWQAAVHK